MRIICRRMLAEFNPYEFIKDNEIFYPVVKRLFMTAIEGVLKLGKSATGN
jgi:hypothetical protein